MRFISIFKRPKLEKMALEEKITEDFYYTVEFKIDKLTKPDLDRILSMSSDFPQTQFREISKLPKTLAQKTSI